MNVETAVKEYLEYLNKETDKKELFDDTKKGSVQFSFNKIPNLQNDKKIQCKLPNSINESDKELRICLIVKDVDPKDRDFEKTIRKYKMQLEKENLSDAITQVFPIKQLKLEFRHFEAKRKLCTSFDLFLSDSCLHDILFNGSKLGKEFKKRKRMPIEVNMDAPLKEQLDTILHSTCITLTGKGPIIDVNTFLSTHTTKQACQNIAAVKAELIKHLPGGESNIKSIYIKSTDQVAVPIFTSDPKDFKAVHFENNMTPVKVKKAKKLSGKRLKRKKVQEERKKIREAKKLKATSGRDLLAENNKENAKKTTIKKVENGGVKSEKTETKEKEITVPKVENGGVKSEKTELKEKENTVPKVAKKAIKKPAKKNLKKSVFIK